MVCIGIDPYPYPAKSKFLLQIPLFAVEIIMSVVFHYQVLASKFVLAQRGGHNLLQVHLACGGLCKSCGIPGNRSTTQRTTFAVLWNLQMVTQHLLLAVNRPVEILKHVVKDTLNLQESTRWSGIPRTVQSLQVTNPGNDFWRPTIFRHFRGGTLSIIGEITTTKWESLDLSNKKTWN